MDEPRNVTPEARPDAGQDAWAWTWDSRRRGFPLLGVLLVLIGIGLLVQYVFPQVSVGTLILLAIGLAFLSAWLFGRSWVAMVPGAFLLALGIGELLEDLAVFRPAGQDVPGLASTALAIGFLAIFFVARAAGRRWSWPIWAAAVFGLIGIAQLSASGHC